MGGIYNTPVISPMEIKQQKFDCILIAVYDFKAIREIHDRLAGLGIAEEKVKTMAIEPEFTEAFMDQRLYWNRDFAKYSYQ